jgi:hypothetical protein
MAQISSYFTALEYNRDILTEEYENKPLAPHFEGHEYPPVPEN